jgi:hypothetical protein
LGLAIALFVAPREHTHLRSAWYSTIDARDASTGATKEMADVNRWEQIWKYLRTRPTTGTSCATGTRIGGASNGFYPIVRLAQLKHIAINGGYDRLLSLNKRDGRKPIGDTDNQHNCWVGAEPWATQVIVENAFTQTEVQEAHSAAQIKHHMARTQQRAPRIKTLQRKEMSAETERLAKVCNNLQDDISHRLEVQQSCSKGFPLATGLVFGTNK